MNTEEMMSDIALLNNQGLGRKTILGSTDVKVLHPSLDIPFTIEKVAEAFHQSEVNIDGIDHEELGLYISFNRSPGERRALGLDLVFPTLRNQKGGRRPL